ncbi:MAG: hypothetical protein K2G67_03090 [Muribaculaceae bacterium]|nr:hypothetical protein [Muribaculaceae bacterium]
MAPQLILTALITAIASDAVGIAFANSYVPMIREDRVWEYHIAPALNPNHTYFSVQFDGTISALGKTYHAFAVKKATYVLGYGDDATYSEESFTDNGIKYFVREEDGKTYTLFYKDDYNEGQIYSTRLPVTQIQFSEDEAASLFEIKMYDATIPNGTVLDLPDIMEGYLDDTPVPVQQFFGKTFDIQEQECILIGYYRCNPDSPSEYEYPSAADDPGMLGWIEGIGVLRQGFLPVYQIHMKTGSPAKSASDLRSDDTWLHGVYTLDGEVLYGEQSVCNGITAISDDASPVDNRMYDLMGHEISAPASGSIYIKGGKKFIAK